MRRAAIWGALLAAMAWAVSEAATSELLHWRQPVYIAAGLVGVLGLCLILVQPLLAGGHLTSPRAGRRIHHWTGAALAGLVAAHVAGLWITSPPDVIDALTFTSPTPFSAWGVIAMWAVLVSASIAMLRGRIRPPVWRAAHTALAVAIVGGTVAHAMLIEGTMGTASKALLCALALASTAWTVARLRAWAPLTRGTRRG